MLCCRGQPLTPSFLFQILQIFVQVFTEWPQMHLAPC